MSLSDADGPPLAPTTDLDLDLDGDPEPPPPPHESRAWVPYVAPMGLFLLLTAGEDYLPRVDAGSSVIANYPLVYAIKIGLVTLALLWSRSTWRDLRPWPGWGTVALGAGLGLLVALAWVGLDGLYPVFGTIGTRAAYDPNRLDPGARAAFLAVRFYGLVLAVPLMEELFWRSLAVRWIADPDRFEAIPIGRVTGPAAAITAGLFALEHPAEWLPALLTGFAWAGLLARSRSLLACVVSHAVANLALGVYVVTTGQWKFW